MNKPQKKETSSDKEVSVAIIPENAQEVNTFNAEGLIEIAIKQQVPVETMERLLAMRRELKAEFAKAAFDRDMARFQGECPVIGKNRMARDESKNKDLYKYAPLDSIVEQVKDLLQKYGFSYAFKTVNTAESVKVTCIAKHREGHAEESTMETTLATRTQIMSGPQQTASTVTFNKRYAFCNAFGIMTGDEDTDAQELPSAPTKEYAKPVQTTAKEVATTFPPSKSQLDLIRQLCEKKGFTKEDILDAGFSKLTGGKDGTASELIDFLIKAKSKLGPNGHVNLSHGEADYVPGDVTNPLMQDDINQIAKKIKY